MLWYVYKEDHSLYSKWDGYIWHRFEYSVTSFYDANFKRDTSSYTIRLYASTQAKLRIKADNAGYASTVLSVKAVNSVQAKLRITTELKAQAKIKENVKGLAKAKLHILIPPVYFFRQARLKITTENSNYASALLRIQTTAYEPAKAKLLIKTKGYSHPVTAFTLGYYEYYGILF